MPSFDVLIESRRSRSPRARQLEGMFDVPPQETETLAWKGDLPIDEAPWSVGLIHGPSGSGKSTIARHLWPDRLEPLTWGAACVLDDFDQRLSMEAISGACQAVGFNTIPSWLRPYAVLSNGEKFRVELARRLVESDGLVVMDEFTSVVDRQVAKIGSHAVQKYVRKAGKRFVAVTCHEDVVDWLQPDWTYDVAAGAFVRRSVQRRPELEVEIRRVPYAAWRLFAPFHYLTRELSRAARCSALFVGGRIAAFAGDIHFPHPTLRGLWRCSRLVTLPDWQGLGLAFVLVDRLGAAYRAVGRTYRTYPAHPALIHAFDRSRLWALRKKPGRFSPSGRISSALASPTAFGGRPCAVFEYVGPAMEDSLEAARFLGISPTLEPVAR